MTANRLRLAPLAALLTAVPALTGLASAQVPEGYAVIGTHTHPGAGYLPGKPGLFLAPLGGGPLKKVTGLPAELRTDSFGAYGQGAFCVSIRSADGAVIVSTVTGPLAPSAGVVKLWIFHLNGDAVDPARTQQLVLGTATNVGSSLNRVLPDNRILVGAVDGNGPLTNGPLANHFLGVVDMSGTAPTVTTLLNPVITSLYVGGMAIAPQGDAVYFVESETQYIGPTQARVRRYDFETAQTCEIATLGGESAFGIVCDDDGTLYVSSTNPTTSTHSIYSVVPDGCNPATVTAVQSSIPLLAWGLDLDRGSGHFVAGSHAAPFPGPQSNALSLVDPITGATTVVASPPPGGWGRLGQQGFAVNNAIESYGASSDGQNHYWFENFPNPGGLPLIGNAGFTLTLRSAPGTALVSMLGLSFGRASIPFAGIDVLIDPATVVLTQVSSLSPTSFPLPIPNSPGLIGREITAQGLHFEANLKLYASQGLSITIQ